MRSAVAESRPTAPHNLDAEKAVLGAVLVRPEALVEAERIVQMTDFWRDGHGVIYQAMLHLAGEGRAIDLVTLQHQLGPAGIQRAGGAAYITSLIDGLPRSSNVEHYAHIVKDSSRARILDAYCQQAIATFSADPAAIRNGAGARFLEAVRREVEAAHDGTAATDRFTTAAESCRDQDQVPMLLEPYLVEGTIGSIVAKVKMGKTTAVLEKVRCLRRGVGFCGFRAPRPRRVLYATEQPRASFVKQLHDAGLQDDDGLIVTYLSSWQGQSWDRDCPDADRPGHQGRRRPVGPGHREPMVWVQGRRGEPGRQRRARPAATAVHGEGRHGPDP